LFQAQVEDIPVSVPRNLFRESLPNPNHDLRTLFESGPQRRRNYGLSALKVADSCAKLADKFGTGRPSDTIQYGINLSSYLVKALAP
jgi:hypothetical protein